MEVGVPSKRRMEKDYLLSKDFASFWAGTWSFLWTTPLWDLFQGFQSQLLLWCYIMPAIVAGALNPCWPRTWQPPLYEVWRLIREYMCFIVWCDCSSSIRPSNPYILEMEDVLLLQEIFQRLLDTVAVNKREMNECKERWEPTHALFHKASQIGWRYSFALGSSLRNSPPSMDWCNCSFNCSNAKAYGRRDAYLEMK